MELKKGETKWVCREKAVLSEACVRWGVTGEGAGAGVKAVPPGKEKYECSPLCADKRPSAGGRGRGHAVRAAAAAPGRGSGAAPGSPGGGGGLGIRAGGAGARCPRTTWALLSAPRAGRGSGSRRPSQVSPSGAAPRPPRLAPPERGRALRALGRPRCTRPRRDPREPRRRGAWPGPGLLRSGPGRQGPPRAGWPSREPPGEHR